MEKGKATCPVHPDQFLHKLRYQKKEPNRINPTSYSTDWYYCEVCKTPVLAQVMVVIKTVDEVRKTQRQQQAAE